jgi:hypothetical protein
LFYGAQIFQASNNQISANGRGGGTANSGIYVTDSGGSWKNGRLEGNRSSNDGGGQNYGITIVGGAAGAIIITGNDLLNNLTGSFSDSSGARGIVANNLCNAGC